MKAYMEYLNGETIVTYEIAGRSFTETWVRTGEFSHKTKGDSIREQIGRLCEDHGEDSITNEIMDDIYMLFSFLGFERLEKNIEVLLSK